MNLGWAVVYLTIMLRVVLLPFTLITENARVKNEELEEDIARLNKEFASDPILKKQEIRKVLRRRRARPWSKAIVLGIQALMLVLLYQVFLRGITGEKILKILYPSVEFPGVINTNFYGYELGERYGILWPGMVALFLFSEIYFDFRHKKTGLTRADLFYFILFPTFAFFILWMLPMVKSLFVFTSLVFSVVIAMIGRALFHKKKKA